MRPLKDRYYRDSVTITPLVVVSGVSANDNNTWPGPGTTLRGRLMMPPSTTVNSTRTDDPMLGAVTAHTDWQARFGSDPGVRTGDQLEVPAAGMVGWANGPARPVRFAGDGTPLSWAVDGRSVY